MRLLIKHLATRTHRETLAAMNGGRGLLKTACLLAALAAGPAVAGTVYRCEGSDGVRSYTSKRVPGASCTAVSTYAEPGRGSKAAPIQTNPVAAASVVAAKGSAASAPSAVGSVSVPAATATATPASATSSQRKARFVRMGASTMYSYVDANGVRNYSNKRPKGVANVSVRRVEYPIFEMETCYACAQTKVDFGRIRLNTSAYKDEIATAARDFGVDEAVVRAIIHAESAFRPTALSRVGAQGLMQLMPATARRFGVSNAFDAGQNIRGGVQYLSWLLKRFNGDLTLAAAGYNAGEGAVDKYKGVPPYGETQRYVQRVGVLADRYRATLSAQ
jgi:soluble lytic murein transglycosylase-like protein